MGEEWQERTVAVVCFSRELWGGGIWTASCCSPQCLQEEHPTCSLQLHTKSLWTVATCLGCLILSLHIPSCFGRAFPVPCILLLGPVTLHLPLNLCSKSTYVCSLSQLVFFPLLKALHPLHFTLNGVCSFALEQEGWGRITEQVPAKPSIIYTKGGIEMAECICKPERLHNKMPFLLSCFVLLQGNSNWRGFSGKFCMLCLLTDGWCLDFETQRPQTASEKPFSPIISSHLLTLKNTCNQRGSCQQAPVQVLNCSQWPLQAPALPAGGGNMQGMTLAHPWCPARALSASAEGELLV